LPEDLNDAVPTIEFDSIATQDQDSETETETESSNALAASQTMSISSMEPPCRDSLADLNDTSTLVVHRRFYDINPSKFKVGLGLWCEKAGISRTDFASLRELLKLVGSPAEMAKIPETVTTLKQQVKGMLPLLNMRYQSIPLIPEKLATETASRKAGPDQIPRENMYFFDPQTLFQAFMSSDIVKKMHIGMAEFRDTPTELWHSHCWASSVRTTSGQYAHCPDGTPIFPSDFLLFCCNDIDCPCQTGQDMHIGRVYSVARDYRSNSTSIPGTVTLLMQEGFRYDDVPDLLLNPPMLKNEVLLAWEQVHYISETCVKSQIEVVLDYNFGESESKKTSKWSSDTPVQVLFARRLIYDINAEPLQITPLCHTHPIRGELELKQYGRIHFVNKWDTAKGNKCISVPLLTFIDGFGLYRNNYRSLMGLLLINN
jgi:hypothetical protein